MNSTKKEYFKLRRLEMSPEYTVSQLTDETRNSFCLTVVEPPLEQFAYNTLHTALRPGTYKLYLKNDVLACSVVPRLNKTPGKPFFYIAQRSEALPLSERPFLNVDLMRTELVCGDVEGGMVHPTPGAYEILIARLLLARQQRKCVYLTVE